MQEKVIIVPGPYQIHTPDFDCDIDSNSNGSTTAEAADQDIPLTPRLDTTLQPHLRSKQCQLLPLISKRLTPGHVLPLSFECRPGNPAKQEKINVTTEQPRLE